MKTLPNTPKEWYEMHTKDWNLSIPWDKASETLKTMWIYEYEKRFTKTPQNTLPSDEA